MKKSKKDIINNIKQTKTAYEIVFKQANITPIVFENSDYELSIIVNKYLKNVEQLINK